MDSLKKASITKQPPLKEQVYDSMLEAIFSGAIKKGEKITEAKVAEYLEVSRTPVREALSMLHHIGVLRAAQNKGYYLYTPTIKEINDVYDIRELIEPAAMAHVVKYTSDEHIAQLEELLATEEKVSKSGDAGAFGLYNMQFRFKLYEPYENAMFQKILQNYSQHMVYVALVTLQAKSVRELVISRQKKIISALKNLRRQNQLDS